MKRLLIAGWRGISHSFAMVNQYQILSLARRGDIALHHVDMPHTMAHWNKRDHDSGFSPEEQYFIERLTPAEESDVDCVYRICSPMFPPNPAARRTLTFGVTELGYDRNNLAHQSIKISEITAGDNLIITPTRWSRDRLLDFGFDEGKVRVVLHGANLDTYRPLTTEEIFQQRNHLGLTDETIVFLNVGVPTWNKGIDLLIRVFATIHKQHKNIRLILKDARKLYGLPVDSVIQTVNQNYPGLITQDVLDCIMVIPDNLKQTELRQLYGFADWYVSPYRAEGFNLPVLEAQACGTPVITTSGGATDDFCNSDGVRKIPSTFRRGDLGKNKDCCWSEPDFPALKEIMLKAVEEGSRKSHADDPMRKLARINAEQHSWDHAVTQLVSFL